MREADERTQQLHTLRMGSLIMLLAVNSGARGVAKWSTITIGTEPHANIEVENHATLFSWSALLATWIAGACALRRPKNEDVAQHDVHTSVSIIIIIIIIIIYSIYRALIPNGPKALYIIKNNNKILNLQNYKTTLSSYKNIKILYNIITNFKNPNQERELQDLSSNGSAFQTEGAAIVNERPP